MKNKIEHFLGLLRMVEPLVIFGSESWLDDTIADSKVFRNDFSVYCRDRNRHGGGVFLPVSKELQSNVSDCDIEAVRAKLFVAGKSLAFGSFYRPPCSGNECFGVLHEIVASHACDTIILGGDFNLPGLSMLDGDLVDPEGVGYREFTCFVNGLDFKQYVHSPTRDGNLRDLLLCNTSNIIQNARFYWYKRS